MEIIGKVIGMNSSDGLINVAVSDASKQIFNVKCSHEKSAMFKIGRIYKFIVEQVFGERISYQLVEAYDAENLDYLKYQKNYSDYTVLSYGNDIEEFFELLKQTRITPKQEINEYVEFTSEKTNS
mgnify:CR=1 FL=1